jgi:hypothetical protein
MYCVSYANELGQNKQGAVTIIKKQLYDNPYQYQLCLLCQTQRVSSSLFF